VFGLEMVIQVVVTSISWDDQGIKAWRGLIILMHMLGEAWKKKQQIDNCLYVCNNFLKGIKSSYYTFKETILYFYLVLCLAMSKGRAKSIVFLQLFLVKMQEGIITSSYQAQDKF
jgi:hypothetical protein